MFCVFSLFTYSLYYIQKVILHTSKIVILILYLYYTYIILILNFASAPKLYLKVIYNIHYTLQW